MCSGCRTLRNTVLKLSETFRLKQFLCLLLSIGLVVIYSAPLLAQTSESQKSDKVVHISVGFSVPPYVLTNKNRGAELDIVREAMALEGYTIIPFYVSNKRRNAEFLDGVTDGAITVSSLEELDGFYSKTYITYQNVAISLAENDLGINRLADLKGMRVVAFQTASKVLGDDFAQLIPTFKFYQEVPKQREQITRLYAGDVDLVIGDKNILAWFVKNARFREGLDTTQPIAIHQVFLPGHKYAVFKKHELTLAFDRGIDALKESGRYDQILAEYGFNKTESDDPS
ncbi:substrate-binding periplasmic protein [Kiloniella majae]|uniref:substrate-binding periplasmic protein n=1 Tax=Kiloniella majae TaxID=1938558 RepID=UPI000A277AA5|nr:ABC transporter substrate-binding protein [Kiloniella majae]